MRGGCRPGGEGRSRAGVLRAAPRSARGWDISVPRAWLAATGAAAAALAGGELPFGRPPPGSVVAPHAPAAGSRRSSSPPGSPEAAWADPAGPPPLAPPGGGPGPSRVCDARSVGVAAPSWGRTSRRAAPRDAAVVRPPKRAPPRGGGPAPRASVPGPLIQGCRLVFPGLAAGLAPLLPRGLGPAGSPAFWDGTFLGGRAALLSLPAAFPPLLPPAGGTLRDATSDQTWRPAEFKHISQRRKRN